MTRSSSPLWIPVGFMAGLVLANWLPLPEAPRWIPFLAHAVVIFHLALGLPLLSVGKAVRNSRVWGALLVVNVVAVPLLALCSPECCGVFPTYRWGCCWCSWRRGLHYRFP